MAHTTYSENLEPCSGISIEGLIHAILPLLKDYGLSNVPAVVIDRFYESVIGYSTGPHLKYTYSEFDGDPYQSPSKTQLIKSHGLAHVSTRQPLHINIEIDDIAWGGKALNVWFSGEEDVVKELKKAVAPFVFGGLKL